MDGRLRNMASIYLQRDGELLLLFRQGSRVADNVWVGSAGGHFEPRELNDACACVLRELREELGVQEQALRNLALRYVTLRHTEDELRQNYYFFAELDASVRRELTSNEGICRWIPREELLSLEMPFSAKHMLRHWLETGCGTDAVYGGIADGEQVVFVEMPAF